MPKINALDTRGYNEAGNAITVGNQQLINQNQDTIAMARDMIQNRIQNELQRRMIDNQAAATLGDQFKSNNANILGMEGLNQDALNQLLEREFRAKEAQANREFGTSERLGAQMFEGDQRGLDRNASAMQGDLQRKLGYAEIDANSQGRQADRSQRLTELALSLGSNERVSAQDRANRSAISELEIRSQEQSDAADRASRERMAEAANALERLRIGLAADDLPEATLNTGTLLATGGPEGSSLNTQEAQAAIALARTDKERAYLIGAVKLGLSKDLGRPATDTDVARLLAGQDPRNDESSYFNMKDFSAGLKELVSPFGRGDVLKSMF